MLSIRVNLLLLTKIMQLLKVGERQEQRALDRLRPGSLAPACICVTASLQNVKDREEGGRTMGTSVYSEAPFSTGNLGRPEPPQQSVFRVSAITVNFWGPIGHLQWACNFQVFISGLCMLSKRLQFYSLISVLVFSKFWTQSKYCSLLLKKLYWSVVDIQ